MAQVFLFTGEEQYLLQQELRKRKTSFVEKYGEQGLFHFRTDDLDPQLIGTTLAAGGMFSEKKLVIVPGIPKDSTPTQKVASKDSERITDYLMKHREQLSPDTILVLLSYKPDKRTKAYKFFAKHADVKTFARMNTKQLAGYALHSLGTLLTNETANYLVSRVGSGLYTLVHECEKLQAYADYHSKTILSEKDIDLIVWSQAPIDSFHILDNLFSNKEKALDLISQAQQQQQDLFQFLGMLYRGLRMVIQMVDLHRQGITSSKEIASTLKIHPFAVAKQYKNMQTLDANYTHITAFLDQLLHLDRSIKSGRFPVEGFWGAVKKSVRSL